jgi:hypothetical protein
MPPSYPSRDAFEQDYPNVKGTGISTDDSSVLIVLVTRKVPEDDLDATEIVPRSVTIDGTTYETDVHPVGIPHFSDTNQATDPADHRRFHDPVPGGVSIGNNNIGAGTMGSCLLEHVESGAPVTLSNAHVAGKAYDQVHPASMDLGGDNQQTHIGTLRETAPLEEGRTHTTDSALIDVDPDVIDSEILGLGTIAGFGDAAGFENQEYTKAGRTTGVTRGKLTARDVSVNVAYGPRTLRFVGCDLFSDMSAPGDSGSLVGYLNPDNDPPGDIIITDLLFAGSDTVTVAIPMDAVQDYHGDLAVYDPSPDPGDGTGNGTGGGSDDSSGDGSGNGSGDGSDDSDDDEETMPRQTLKLDPSIRHGSLEYSFDFEGECEFTGNSSTQVDQRMNGWSCGWNKVYHITGYLTDVSLPEKVDCYLDGDHIPIEMLVERSQSIAGVDNSDS